MALFVDFKFCENSLILKKGISFYFKESEYCKNTNVSVSTVMTPSMIGFL